MSVKRGRLGRARPRLRCVLLWDQPAVCNTSPVQPPKAQKLPHAVSLHGEHWEDPYHWMRNREDPEIRAYLEAENDYTKTVMSPTEALQKQLYDEMLARIKEDDTSVPVRRDDFLYYNRVEKGKNYAIWCRKACKRGEPESSAGPEEVMLDENVLAEGHAHLSVGLGSIRPDHKLLAFGYETSGDEVYTVRVRDLATGNELPDAIDGVGGGLEWSADGRYLFYGRLDDAHRPYQVWRHELGTPSAADVLVYEETDEAYFLHVGKTRSRAYLVLQSQSQVGSEVRVLKADDPCGVPVVVEPRRPNIEYQIEHWGEQFYVLTNDDALNFRLMVAPIQTPGRAYWREVIAHDDNVLLEDFDAFASFAVLSRRRQGLPELCLFSFETSEAIPIEMPDPTYSVGLGANPEFGTTVIRFHYSSLVTPSSVFDHSIDTGKRVLRKQDEVGGYDLAQLTSERIFATAPDGTQVPISLLRRKQDVGQGPQPFMLTGYGAYGHTNDAYFSSLRLSLIDRGCGYAIAHIRGGAELGRKWYEEGKFHRKQNTFGDFVACAEAMVAHGYTTHERLAIMGGSAGGLLIGAVLNQRPGLCRVALADVPFVDVIHTMLDETLPLTVVEYDEWGNPNDPSFFRTMRAYSPYDNVAAQAYPHLLVLAGWSDPRVQVWEPAKWVAKLREHKTDNNMLLLRTNFDAGHGGASGRYEAIKEVAFEYAFALRYLSIVEVPAT